MNVDSRLLRRSVVGMCAIALFESLFVAGCVNGPHFYKPHFWDKGDVTADEDPNANSQKDQKTAKTPTVKTLPTATLASSANPQPAADAPPGRVEIVDYRSPASGMQAQQVAGTVDPQAAPQLGLVNPPANGNIFAPYVQGRPPVGGVDNSRHNDEIVRTDPVVSKDLNDELNPFAGEKTASANTAAPLRIAKGAPAATAKPVDPFGDIMDQQIADAHKTADQPTASSSPNATAASSPDATGGPAKKSPAASQTPDISLVAAAQPSMTAAATKPTATASNPASAPSGDVFDEAPKASATDAAKAPTARVAADVFADDSSAAPAPRSVSAVKSPPANLAPPQRQLADADAWQSVQETPKPAAPNVIPAAAAAAVTTAAPAVEPAPSLASSVAEPPQNLAAPASTSSEAVSDSADAIICDSSTVRGRFLGTSSAPAGSAGRLTANKRRATSSRAYFSAGSNGAAAVADVPAPNDEPWAQTRTAAKRSGKNVISAVGRRVGNQLVEESVDPQNRAGRAQTASAEIPQPFDPEGVEAPPPAAKPAADPLVAPEPPAEETRMQSEAWFAIGLALGLASCVIAWLRFRQRTDNEDLDDNEEPATTAHREAA